MPIDTKIKEVLISTTNDAIDDLKKSRFNGMKSLLRRIIAFSALIPDKDWIEELKLSATIIGAVGSTTEKDFEDMDEEKKNRIISSYTDLLRSFVEALQNDDIPKMDKTLKSITVVFVDEILG